MFIDNTIHSVFGANSNSTNFIEKRRMVPTAEGCLLSPTSEEIVAHVNGKDDLAADVRITRLLQQPFDEEYNASKDQKDLFNKTAVIQTESGEEEDTEDFRDHKDWDQSETVTTEISKHDDIIFCNEKGTEFVKSKSNKVDNRFRLHWKNYETVTKFGLDEYNRTQLYQLIKNQTLEKINYIMHKGQHSVLLHAERNSAYPDVLQSKECVVKVFTVTKSEFMKRGRRNVSLWAKREMLNLIRLKKARILCPEVIAVRNHMLVMSFIGKDHKCALALKFTNLTVNEYISAYHQVVAAMKSLFNSARLVHTNLSECNILWHNKRCYFIDLSLAWDLKTPYLSLSRQAFSFLFEDCKNVIKFFTFKRLPNIITAEELFMEITGCDYNSEIELNGLAWKLSSIEPH